MKMQCRVTFVHSSGRVHACVQASVAAARALAAAARAVPLSLAGVFLESINRLHSPTCSLSKT